MSDYTEEARYNLPTGTGKNPMEDYNENFEMTDEGSGWVYLTIATGEGGSAGEWYTHDNSGDAKKAQADDIENCETLFVLTEDKTAGEDALFLKAGWVEVSGWGLTAGETYFLDTSTAGGMTTTKPVTGEVVYLGFAKTTEKFHIQITREGGEGEGDTEIEVRNDSGAIIEKGSLVYISGFNGMVSLPTVEKAKSDASGTTPAIGVVIADIANGSSGTVRTDGIIEGIDTSSFSAGDELWVSDTTAGEFTASEPTTSYKQVAGYCIVSNASSGIIFVEIGKVGAGEEPIEPAVMTVTNGEGAQIDKGDAVCIKGATAGVPTVQLALSGDAVRGPFLGVANETIADGADGEIVICGRVSHTVDFIDGSMSYGTPLWVSDETAGQITSVEPDIFEYKMFAGYVIDYSSPYQMYILPDRDIDMAGEGRVKVYNDSGYYFSHGDPVRISSYNGTEGLPEIQSAQSDSITTTPAVGLVDGGIADGSSGWIITQGLFLNFDTSGFSVNDELWLDDITSAVVNTEPTTDNKQLLGHCLIVDSSDGVIVLHPGRVLDNAEWQDAVPATILVDKNADDVEGVIYSDLTDAVEYSQDNAQDYIIEIGAGMWNLEESLIIDSNPVLFVGQGKEKTTLNFDRTDEDASHYFLRANTNPNAQYNTRYCIGFCGYTDQTSYGEVDTADWDGRYGLKDLTIEMEYSGDSSTPTYMSGIYTEHHEGKGFDFIFENIRFQNIGAPTMAKSDAEENHRLIYSDAVSNTAGDETQGYSPICRGIEGFGDKTLTGTVSVTSGNTSLSGTGTDFTEELNEEGYIEVGEYIYEIASITDDTTATLGRAADSSESGVQAIAVNPFNSGIRIQMDVPDIEPNLIVKDCTFRYFFQRAIYVYAGVKTHIDSIYLYACGVNLLKGDALTVDKSAIYVNASNPMIENIVFRLEHYLNNVFPDNEAYAIGIGQYATKADIENIEFSNDANTWNYVSCIYSRTRINVKNISADNYTYDAVMIAFEDSSDCSHSVLDSVYSSRTQQGAITIPANVEGVKIVDSFFERGIIANGDYTVIQNCYVNAGSDTEIYGKGCVVAGCTILDNLLLGSGCNETMIHSNYIDGSIYGTACEELSITNNRVMNKGAEGEFTLGKQSCMSNNYWNFHDDTYLTGAHYCEITGNTFYVQSSATATNIFDFDGDMITFIGNTVQVSSSADSRIINIDGGGVIADNIFEGFSFSKRIIHVASRGNVRVANNRFDGVTSLDIVGVEGDHSHVVNNSFECTDSLCIHIMSTARFGVVSGNVMEVGAGPVDVVDIGGDDCCVKGNIINNADIASVTDYFDVSGDYNIFANNIVRSRGNGTMINDTGTGNVTDNNLEDTRA